MKTATTLFARILFFSLAALGVCNPPAHGLDEEQYDRFYRAYYSQPQPELLPEAFEHCVRSVGETVPERDSEYRQSAEIRFFALVGSQNPDLIRRAIALYPDSSWPQKQALLDFFHYIRDDAAIAALNQWAQAETDNDRRIEIQKCLTDREAPTAILSRSLREETLESQWAAFYATGNTRVAAASMDWLSNTPPGQASSPLPISSRTKRFRQQVLEALSRNFYHPPVQATVFAKASSLDPAMGKILVKNLAEQVMDFPSASAGATDPYPSQNLLPLVAAHFHGQVELTFFQGAVAVRARQPAAAAEAVQALQAVQGPWAECLRGFAAYRQLLERESAWQRTSVPAGGKPVMDACIQAWDNTQTFAFFEVSQCLKPGGERQTVKLSAAYSKPDQRRFYVILRPEFTEARLVHETAASCWTDRVRKWIPIRERLSVELAESMTSSGPLQELMQNVPVSIVRIAAPEGELAQAVYEDVDVAGLIPHLLTQFHVGAATGRVSMTFDPAASRILTLAIQAALISRENDADVVKAKVDVTRVYYDHDVPNLAWSQTIGQ